MVHTFHPKMFVCFVLFLCSPETSSVHRADKTAGSKGMYVSATPAFNPSSYEQKQVDLCKLEASLVCTSSSRIVRTTQ